MRMIILCFLFVSCTGHPCPRLTPLYSYGTKVEVTKGFFIKQSGVIEGLWTNRYTYDRSGKLEPCPSPHYDIILLTSGKVVHVSEKDLRLK